MYWGWHAEQDRLHSGWHKEEYVEYVSTGGFYVEDITLIKGKPLSEAVLTGRKK